MVVKNFCPLKIDDMFSLIFFLIFGSGLTFFALQNTAHVSLSLFNQTYSDVPLFSVIIGSMLIGVLLSFLISMVNSIATSFTLRGKDKKIKETEKSLNEVTKKNHQLEIENEVLKKDNPAVTEDDKSL